MSDKTSKDISKSDISKGQKAINTQLKKYGSKEALSAEMSRRAKMRKNVGGGFRDNPALASRAGLAAAEKRRVNEKLRVIGGSADLSEKTQFTETKTTHTQESIESV